MKLFAHSNGSRYEIDLAEEPGHLLARAGEETYIISLDDNPGAIRTVFVSGDRRSPARKIEFGWTRRENVYSILIDGIAYEIEVRDARAERTASFAKTQGAAAGRAEVRAPIPGRITRVLTPEGVRVARNQAVLTLDAMKLENEIQAPQDGVVRALSVKPGDAVEKSQLLFVIES